MASVAPQWRALCWTPFLTGVRPGELFALHSEEIDRAANLVDLHQNGRQARAHPDRHQDDAPRRREGAPRSLDAVSAVARVDDRRRAGVAGRGAVRHAAPPRVAAPQLLPPGLEAGAGGERHGLHALRRAHTFSSRLLAAGLPLVEVAAWMGHSLRAGGAALNTTSRTTRTRPASIARRRWPSSSAYSPWRMARPTGRRHEQSPGGRRVTVRQTAGWSPGLKPGAPGVRSGSGPGVDSEAPAKKVLQLPRFSEVSWPDTSLRSVSHGPQGPGDAARRSPTPSARSPRRLRRRRALPRPNACGAVREHRADGAPTRWAPPPYQRSTD